MNRTLSDRKQLEDWADMIEKAEKEGVFDDGPDEPSVGQQTSDSSFFGLQNTNASEEPSEKDVMRWNQVYDLSQGNSNVISEELSKKEKGDAATKIAQTPNPIRQSSVGKDQDLDPRPLGQTYTDEELNKLGELKIKLHDLEDKINAYEGNAETGGKLDSQIEGLKKQIDDLSDSLGQGLEISYQGD